MGDLEKMQTRPCRRGFFRASRRKRPSTSKSRRLDLLGRRSAMINTLPHRTRKSIPATTDGEWSALE
jgi:hypothetical protein